MSWPIVKPESLPPKTCAQAENKLSLWMGLATAVAGPSLRRQSWTGLCRHNVSVGPPAWFYAKIYLMRLKVHWMRLRFLFGS
jgi:hypothetical protein